MGLALTRGGTPHSIGAEAAEPIVYYDMTPLFRLDLHDPTQRRQFWDETHLVVSLQGLVNRRKPLLYLRYVQAPDDFWWKEMTAPGAWLAGRPVDRITSLKELLERFRRYYRGSVVWDERVPSTSNLASSIAGADDLLCLRYDDSPDSLYRRLTESGPALEVKKRLLAADGAPLFTGKGRIPDTTIQSTGSAKCDSYLWLIDHYVKNGKLNPALLGYYVDGFWLQCWSAAGTETHNLTNHDFVIARRGLVFDLGPWDDECPVDDPAQPAGTDASTLKTLLRSAYDRLRGAGIIHVAGFVPWAHKYTNFKSRGWSAGGRRDGVPTEWRYAEILSCFNAYMDADALGISAMANASFFQHFPLKRQYRQNPKPDRASLQARGLIDAAGRIAPRRYVAHYVGDYDSAAWLYQMLPRMWTDPARGTTPLSWAFNPNLSERFPFGMAWARERAKPNDWFVAGDSGAGYLNPGFLTPPRPHSGLPSGLAAWESHCRQFYRQWDISLTGFVIDGYARGLSTAGLDAYARFSRDGIIAQKIAEQGIHQKMPYLRMATDLPDDPEQAARAIAKAASGPSPCFVVCRSILKAPTWYKEVQKHLSRMQLDIEVVDLYTLLSLVRQKYSHTNDSGRSATTQMNAF